MVMMASAVARQLMPPAGASASGAVSGGEVWSAGRADDSVTASSLRGGKNEGAAGLSDPHPEHDGAVRRHSRSELPVERAQIPLLPQIADDARTGDTQFLPRGGHVHRLESPIEQAGGDGSIRERPRPQLEPL